MGLFDSYKAKKEEKRKRKEAQDQFSEKLKKYDHFGFYEFSKIKAPAFLDVFFEKRPCEKYIFDELRKRPKGSLKNSDFEQFLVAGAKYIFKAHFELAVIIITKEMMLLWYDDLSRGIIIPAPYTDMIDSFFYSEKIESYHTYTTTETPKQKSVVANAAVGALLAGPVGAVVGAAYAADKNAHSTPSVTVHRIPISSDSSYAEYINPFKMYGSTYSYYLHKDYVITIDRGDVFLSDDISEEFKKRSKSLNCRGQLRLAAELSWGIRGLYFERLDKKVAADYPEWKNSYDEVAEFVAEFVESEFFLLKNDVFSEKLAAEWIMTDGIRAHLEPHVVLDGLWILKKRVY